MYMVKDYYGKIVKDLADKHSKKTVIHKSEKKTIVIHKLGKKRISEKK